VVKAYDAFVDEKWPTRWGGQLGGETRYTFFVCLLAQRIPKEYPKNTQRIIILLRCDIDLDLKDTAYSKIYFRNISTGRVLNYLFRCPLEECRRY